jgi:SAM-dependent methyltransferase
MAGSDVLGHEHREDRKISGATYTPSGLAAAVSQRLMSLVAGTLSPKGRIKVLEPAVGDGALLHALLGTLSIDVRRRLEVTGFDIDSDAILKAETRLSASFPEVSFELRAVDFLEFSVKERHCGSRYDLIIANPPYVRVQSLDVDTRDRIRAEFDVGGRMDLAYPFIMAMCDLLAPQGLAAVITSNRVLSTNAGHCVREYLLRKARLLDIWDMGDTRLFDAAVLPCVLYFGTNEARSDQGSCGFSTVYEDKDCGEPVVVEDICRAVMQPGSKMTPDGRKFTVRRGVLSADAGWRISVKDEADWIDRVTAGTWRKFEDVSKISVGIKSTADKVFIAEAWDDPRPELLRPLVTHHIAGRFRATSKPVREVLYPHVSQEGRRMPVLLDEHPVSKAYLMKHEQRLAGRSYVQSSGREWFEIWVPHNPCDWEIDKIVFRDIAERPTFWLQQGGAVVNGDCYWIKLSEGIDPDLVWLMLAVANSRLIERFYDIVFNERLYAGRRRFMARHVRLFPLPDPYCAASAEASRLAKRLACDEALVGAERERTEVLVESLVEEAFGASL